MKKIPALVLVLALCVPAARARAEGSVLSSKAGFGAWYDATPLPEWPLSILAAIFNLRGGPWIDLLVRPDPSLGLGLELGLQYMRSSFELGGMTYALDLVDLPARVKASWSGGPFRLETFTGLFTRLAVEEAATVTIVPDLWFDGGLRIFVADVWAEASLAMPIPSGIAAPFGRFGLGWSLRLLD